MKLQEFLKSKGYDIADTEAMNPYIELWKSWYKGNVPKFQNYYVYNGEKKIRCKRRTLNMGKKVPEDWANLLLNEKVVYQVGNKEESKLFNDILDENDFYVLGNEAVEKSFALGMGAFVPSLTDIEYDTNTEVINFKNAKLKIDFVTVDKIIPLSYRGRKIVECAFIIDRVINNQKMLLLSLHIKNKDGNYIIRTYTFKIKKNGSIEETTETIDKTLNEFDTKSSNPWFSILRPNICNNIYFDSPFGVSVFSNAIDVFEGLDISYDSLINEFVLGRKRIFVTGDLLKPDMESGELKLSFDTNDMVYHSLPGQTDDKGGKIIESDMKLRVAEHEQGIQTNLNLLSSKVGLGDGYYKFEKGSVATATQVVSENSDLFRTIKKHELSIENCLFDLFRTMLYIMSEFLNVPVKQDAEITINFDDSIIEDTAEIKRQALLEFNAKLIDAIEYYKKVYNMDQEQAEEYYKTIQDRMPIETEPTSE